MSKTLVTGGAGFIGSHVAHALAERGDELRLTVRESTKKENLAGLEHEEVKCDLLDRRQVRRALRDVDRVFHCAGMTSLRASDAERLFEVNVIATRNLLEECLRAGVERVVYTSSVAAIGPAPAGGRADENQLFTAGKLGIPYVNSKHEAEVEAFGWRRRACRSCASTRASCSARATSTAARRRSSAASCSGGFPAYVDGAINIVDVQDVARGHLLADERGSVGERYILGNRNYTLDRLFADLGRVSGVEPPALKLPPAIALRLAQALEAAPGRPPITVDEVKSAGQWWTYKTTKAKRELGWTTSPHEDTIEATVNWYIDREGDRFKRSRRSQPIQYKLAAAMLGIVRRPGS